MGSLLGNVRLKPKGDVADEATSFPVMQGRSRKGLDNFFNPDGLSWGTTSRETAEQFAGRNEVYWPNRTPPESSVEFSGDVYDLNFNLKNPMDVDISQTLWDRNKELALVSEAKSAGHDGLRISHPSGKVDYVAFYPSQVSRATPPSPAEEGSGLLAPSKPAGIRAYHGSPHSFDKFSMDKIGTGEGAQAYGHGLYFAEAEDVAKKYRDDLAGWGSAGAGRTLEAVGGDVDRAILETQQKLDRLLERNASGAFKGAERNFNMQRQIQEDKIAQLKAYKDTGGFSAGSMYEVNINANPDDFLDWDAPAPQQSERVRKALTSIANSDPEVMSNFREAMARGDSGSIYEAILQDKTGTVVGNQAGAAKRLREAGIPGIKYKDAGSRGTDAATRNFVVFDENLINIVKKYGIAGAATMLGVSAMDVEQAMAQGYQPSSQQPQGLLAQGAQ
jgi:hypothetical protein